MSMMQGIRITEFGGPEVMSLEEVPDGPMILLANEFFDSLPIQQAVMCVDGWHERVVKVGEGDRFDGPAVVARLSERKVFVDCRPGVGLRLSPHFFNTDEEVHQAMEILAELMG